MKKNEFKIFSFYQFKKIETPLKLKSVLKDFCQYNKLKGTLLIANEGINGSISGLERSVKEFQKKMINLGFKSLTEKYTSYPFIPFNRLKIRIKKEIITFSKKKLDVEYSTAAFVDPDKWNKLIDEREVCLIDVRNDYESNIGTFQNSIKCNTKKFTDFKKFIKKHLIKNKSKKIALFCTGGIRCEKASSYMYDLGFKNLYQLKGGILNYLQNISKEKTKWNGECFLFDNRVSVKNEMKKGSYELCHGCRVPITKKDKFSKKFEYGVSCHNCYDNLTKEKVKNLRQRNKQIEIAKKRGLYSPYIRYTSTDY